MNVIMEFATPIGMFHLDKQMCLDSSKHVENLLSSNIEGIHKHAGLVETTPDNIHLKSDFFPVVNSIQHYVDKFTEDVLGVDKHDIELSCMWSNSHKSGSKHHFHQHPNSFLSGVVYVKCPPAEEIGNIVFIDPRQAKNMIHPNFKKDSCISNRNIWVKPELGLLLLFPSWLEHGTDTYISSSNENRISISFNYKLKPFHYKFW